jgi:hypothetical protein
VTVTSLDVVEETLRRGGLPSRRAGDVLVAPFPDELGKGAWMFGEGGRSELFD